MGQSGENDSSNQLEISINSDRSLYLHYADLEALQQQQGAWFHTGTIPEEHARAERFIKPEHQQRFLAARYFLRQVLAEYTGEKAPDIKIAFTEQEKPYLADHALPFNLSHSGQYAVVGVCREGDLGVDIETRSSLKTAIQVAPRIMTNDEHEAWEAVPESAKMATFIQYWTLKEAILKAHGDGLLQDPRGIGIDLEGSEPRISFLKEVFGKQAWWRVGFAGPPAPFPRIAWALRI
ncbi:MAG: 4'-phosphopantetheinyl transferase superfamily protein [Puniceicoccaceae bacterium]